MNEPQETQSKPEAGLPLVTAHGSALAPCPFCGLTDKDTVSPDIGLVPAVAMHSYPQGYRIECEGCSCDGPWHHQHTEAIAAWNRRPNDQAQRRRDAGLELQPEREPAIRSSNLLHIV